MLKIIVYEFKFDRFWGRFSPVDSAAFTPTLEGGLISYNYYYDRVFQISTSLKSEFSYTHFKKSDSEKSLQFAAGEYNLIVNTKLYMGTERHCYTAVCF